MSENNVLSREDLLTPPAPQIQPVKLPTRGGIVYVRPMSAAESERYSNLPSSQQTMGGIAVRVLCDKDGNLLFERKEAGLLASRLLMRDMMAIVKVAAAQNGLKVEGLETIEAELDGEAENPTE